MSDLFRREPQQQQPGPGHERSEQPAGPLTRVLLAAGVVLTLVLVAGGTTWWLYSQDPVDQSAAHRTPGPCDQAELRVVAAPEIAPVVQAAARTLNGGGDCGPVEVVAEEPAVTATTPRQPDVWIPSGSAWLQIALIGGTTAYRVDGQPLARSPIVLAAPEAVTPRFATGDQTTWMKLLAGVTSRQVPAVTMPDPLHTSVGMLAVYAVQVAMDKSTPDAGIAQLRTLTLRSRLKDATADPATLLAKVAAQTDAAARGRLPDHRAAAHHLSARWARGAVDRVVPGRRPDRGRLPVRDLDDHRAPGACRSAARGDQQAGAHRGGLPAVRDAAHHPGAASVPRSCLAPAAQWAQYRSLAFQVLLLIDASGSMNKPVTDKAGRRTHQGRAAAPVRAGRRPAVRRRDQHRHVVLRHTRRGQPARTPRWCRSARSPRAIGGQTRREALATAIGALPRADGGRHAALPDRCWTRRLRCRRGSGRRRSPW